MAHPERSGDRPILRFRFALSAMAGMIVAGMTVDPCYAIVRHIILKSISVILAREMPITFQLNETDFVVEFSVGRREWPFGRIW